MNGTTWIQAGGTSESPNIFIPHRGYSRFLRFIFEEYSYTQLGDLWQCNAERCDINGSINAPSYYSIQFYNSIVNFAETGTIIAGAGISFYGSGSINGVSPNIDALRLNFYDNQTISVGSFNIPIFLSNSMGNSNNIITINDTEFNSSLEIRNTLDNSGNLTVNLNNCHVNGNLTSSKVNQDATIIVNAEKIAIVGANDQNIDFGVVENTVNVSMNKTEGNVTFVIGDINLSGKTETGIVYVEGNGSVTLKSDIYVGDLEYDSESITVDKNGFNIYTHRFLSYRKKYLPLATIPVDSDGIPFLFRVTIEESHVLQFENATDVLVNDDNMPIVQGSSTVTDIFSRTSNIPIDKNKTIPVSIMEGDTDIFSKAYAVGASLPVDSLGRVIVRPKSGGTVSRYVSFSTFDWPMSADRVPIVHIVEEI